MSNPDQPSPPNKPEEPKKTEEPRPASARLVLAGSLLSSLLTGAITWAITDRQVDASLKAQEDGIAAERKDRDRDRDAEIYTTFNDAALEWASTTLGLQDCATDARLPDRTGADKAALARCIQESDINTDRETYIGAYSDLYVYGSEEAVAAASDVREILPETGGERPFGERSLTALFDEPLFDWSEFRRANIAFLRVMCRELPPAGGRSGCRDG